MLAVPFSAVETSDNTGLIITDLAGQYTVNNIGGWESPNPALSSALTATLLIEMRNADGTWTASPSGAVNLFPTLPSETFGTITVTAAQAGYGATGTIFQDGIYRLTYTVTGNNGSAYSYSSQQIFYMQGNIQCCYQQYALACSTCNCVCDDVNRTLQNIALYNRLLQAAINAQSPNLSQIQTFINQLTAFCQNCGGCSGGCSGC